jgi:hypothetical protein
MRVKHEPAGRQAEGGPRKGHERRGSASSGGWSDWTDGGEDVPTQEESETRNIDTESEEEKARKKGKTKEKEDSEMDEHEEVLFWHWSRCRVCSGGGGGPSDEKNRASGEETL